MATKKPVKTNDEHINNAFNDLVETFGVTTVRDCVRARWASFLIAEYNQTEEAKLTAQRRQTAHEKQEEINAEHLEKTSADAKVKEQSAAMALHDKTLALTTLREIAREGSGEPPEARVRAAEALYETTLGPMTMFGRRFG